MIGTVWKYHAVITLRYQRSQEEDTTLLHTTSMVVEPTGPVTEKQLFEDVWDVAAKEMQRKAGSTAEFDKGNTLVLFYRCVPERG